MVEMFRKKYRYSTGMGEHKLVVYDLSNNKSTIYYASGKIETYSNYAYRADDKDFWYDTLHDCIASRIEYVKHITEHVKPELQLCFDSKFVNDEVDLANKLYKFYTDNPVESLYKD